MTLAVRTEGLVKRYDGTLAVAGVDLEIAAGEIHGLVGPNGAGKTTTLKMLATVLEPTAGQATVAGHRRGQGTRLGPSRHRLHARQLRRLRRHEGLGVPRLLRPLLRPAGGAPAPDDRRPARAGRPGRQARRVRPGAQPGHAAAPLPGPHAGPRPAACCSSTSRPPASTRGPASSCASCSASCAPWARRSSSAATSCPSSRSCAPASPSSTTAASSHRAAWPTSKRACAPGPCSRSASWATRSAIEAAAAFVRADGGRGRRRAARRRLARDRLHRRRRCQRRAARASVGAGHRVAVFSRAASDLEELFLQVTAREASEAAARPEATDDRRRRPSRNPLPAARPTRLAPGRRRASSPSAPRSCAAGCAAGARSPS